MNATTKLAEIVKTIESGKTVTISTAWKAWEITPRTWAKWVASGHSLLKVKGESLYMARGKAYDCIDLCKFTVR